MKVSYSLLAANHLDLMRDLDNKKSQFDSIHFDFIDENYCGGLGLSVITLEQLCNLSNFDINVHVLMNKPKDITHRIFENKIKNINYHVELLKVNEFKSLNLKHAKKGVAIKLDSNLRILENFIPFANSVLLLCMNPSLEPNNEKLNPVKRVEEFRNLFPNYNGKIFVDGGVNKENIQDLKNLNVDTVVVGSSYIN